MSDASLTSELNEMKQQLRSLSACLSRANLLSDQSGFYSVVSELEGSKPRNGVLNWKYSLGKTELKLDAAHVRWPRNTSALVCVFDLKVVGRVCNTVRVSDVKPAKRRADSKPAPTKPRGWDSYTLPNEEICWIIDVLCADLQLLAHAGGDPKWEQFWHFDRHITKAQSTSTNEPLEVHPLFHFQFGGDRLADGRKTNQTAWGNLLELHSPRIAHPPLDIVLLIDFILANFAGRAWKDLVENKKEYHAIVEAAQRRFWCPYKRALSDYFQTDAFQQTNHLARSLWPSLARRVK